jgi:PPOX class probable F420-dependent enzyme
VPSPLLDPDRADDAHIAERLASERVIWFGSTRPDGRPHHVPVWFLWADPVVRLYASPGTQKLRNIAANPSVVLSLDTADAGADVVLLEGVASLLEGAPLDARFRAKYDPVMPAGAWDGWAAGFSQPVVVEVRRVLAWISTPEGPQVRDVPASM